MSEQKPLRLLQVHLSTIVVMVVLFAAWLAINTKVQAVDAKVKTYGIGFPALFYLCSENPHRAKFPTGKLELDDLLRLQGVKHVDVFGLLIDAICTGILFYTVGSICEYMNRRHTKSERST